jgi:hypothetical protein
VISSSSLRKQGPTATAGSFRAGWSDIELHNKDSCLWVPAFAGRRRVCGALKQQRLFSTSPRLRGEVASFRQRLRCPACERVRGTLDRLGLAESPPHPKFAIANFDLSPQAGRGESAPSHGHGISFFKQCVHEHSFAISPHAREFFQETFCPRDNRGRRESRVPMHPQPRVQCRKHTSAVTTGSPETIPAFPAQWFYGLLRALPGDRACLPPSSCASSRKT